VYLIQHYVIKLSVTYGRLVVFSGYSGFLHKTVWDNFKKNNIAINPNLP